MKTATPELTAAEQAAFDAWLWGPLPAPRLPEAPAALLAALAVVDPDLAFTAWLWGWQELPADLAALPSGG